VLSSTDVPAITCVALSFSIGEIATVVLDCSPACPKLIAQKRLGATVLQCGMQRLVMSTIATPIQTGSRVRLEQPQAQRLKRRWSCIGWLSDLKTRLPNEYEMYDAPNSGRSFSFIGLDANSAWSLTRMRQLTVNEVLEASKQKQRA